MRPHFDYESVGRSQTPKLKGFAVKRFLLATAAAAFLIAGPASADPLSLLYGYSLSATFQAAAAPSYQGSHKYSVFPSGNVSVTHPWQFDDYAAPDDAASLALYNSKFASFGLAAAIIEDRGNSHELQGMRNIGWGGETGGFVNVWPMPWLRLRVEALKGVFAEDGLLVNTSADVVAHEGPWMFSVGPRFSWADDHYNGTYFGVTPGEALASRRYAAYQANGGPLFAGLEAATEVKVTSRWRLTLNGTYHRLLSEDAASPLVRQAGTADQFAVASGVRFLLN